MSTLNEFIYYSEEEFCLPFMFACHMCFNVMCLIIFGKKLIRAYICIMYVPNQNKVFVFVFILCIPFHNIFIRQPMTTILPFWLKGRPGRLSFSYAELLAFLFSVDKSIGSGCFFPGLDHSVFCILRVIDTGLSLL